MSATSRFDDPLRQDGWSVQPTHHEGEWTLAHDGLRTTFHEARLITKDGIAHAVLVRHSDDGTVDAAEVSIPDAPWRIETWLRELAAETSGVER